MVAHSAYINEIWRSYWQIKIIPLIIYLYLTSINNPSNNGRWHICLTNTCNLFPKQIIFRLLSKPKKIKKNVHSIKRSWNGITNYCHEELQKIYKQCRSSLTILNKPWITEKSKKKVKKSIILWYKYSLQGSVENKVWIIKRQVYNNFILCIKIWFYHHEPVNITQCLRRIKGNNYKTVPIS